MIALIVTEPGTPRGLLAYAFDLAGLDTREVLSVDQADSLVRLLGSRNCVVVIEAESLSEAPGCGTWRAFLRSRSELPVVVTACSTTTNDSIRDLVAEEDRILLERSLRRGRRGGGCAQGIRLGAGRDGEHMLSRITDKRVIDLLVPRDGKVRAAAVGCEGGGR